jgi:predicted permease
MWNDIRYALKTLARERGYATAAILSLAVGIGANTAIFSVVNGVLLRPLPYGDPERLFSIREMVPAFAHLYPSLPANLNHYFEWRNRCSAIESAAIMRQSSVDLTGAGDPVQLDSARISANTLQVLGVRPQLGRGFLEEEDQAGHDQEAMLSDSLWKHRFHADPSILGRKITLGGSPYLVVGVLPASFQFPNQDSLGSGVSPKPDILQPFGYTKDELQELAGDFNYSVVARLRPGVTSQRAIAELNVIQASIDAKIPERLDLRIAMTSLHEQTVGHVRRGLLVLLGAVGAVLLILCVNLANLALARAAGRAREFAIRTALGAGRAQLVRQTLAESLMLSIAGGALGVLLAWWGVRLLIDAAPVDLPRLNEIQIDGQVLLFAVLVSMLTGLVFGILPAMRSAGAQPQEALKSGNYTTTEGRRGVRVRDLLVGLEAALSAVLLITAGLLMSSFLRLMHVDKGFDVQRVLTADLALPSTKYTGDGQKAAFFERVLDKTRPLPGVLSAAFVSALPLRGETWIDMVGPEGDTRPMFQRPSVNVRFITPEYFKTLRIPFREGESFNDGERHRDVAIISHGTAERLWPGRSALGRRLLHNDKPTEVVGVTQDIRGTSLDHDPVLMLYLPEWQRPRLSASLLVRTAMDPLGVAAGVREAVRQVDPDVPVPEMKTMEEVMSDSVAQRRFQMMLVLLFAGAALALAGFGIYGVVSYSVTRRRAEMGIRMALGAGAAGLQRMILWQGIRPVVLGLGVGIAAALAAGRVLSSLLFQVSWRDPLTIGVVTVALLLVSAGAALGPARKAARVDPMRALRFE